MRQSYSSPILPSLNNVLLSRTLEPTLFAGTPEEALRRGFGRESLTGSEQTLDDLGPSAEESQSSKPGCKTWRREILDRIADRAGGMQSSREAASQGTREDWSS